MNENTIKTDLTGFFYSPEVETYLKQLKQLRIEIIALKYGLNYVLNNKRLKHKNYIIKHYIDNLTLLRASQKQIRKTLKQYYEIQN